MIELRNICFRAGDKEILQDVNLQLDNNQFIVITGPNRSEERRVGKECRSRWSPYH